MVQPLQSWRFKRTAAELWYQFSFPRSINYSKLAKEPLTDNFDIEIEKKEFVLAYDSKSTSEPVLNKTYAICLTAMPL